MTLYLVLTHDGASGGGGYAPQQGCPSIVRGFGGLRRAARRLRELSYEADRRDFRIFVRRVVPAVEATRCA
ncbi:MAG: hypothetical protein AAGI54_08260 [Planctomycetota bacterium]